MSKRVADMTPEQRERKREHQRRYREENQGKDLERNRRYREENREKVLERNRRYREENREKERERNRRYREENRELLNIAKVERRKENHRWIDERAVSGRSWTEYEDAVVAKLPDKTAAYQLRRTVNAVSKRRSRLRRQGIVCV